MNIVKKQNLENYFYIFVRGFLGFLTALFFLHFIHYTAIRDILLMEEKIDLISFLRETQTRQVEAVGIFLSFSLLGGISGIIGILRQRIKEKRKRIKFLEDISRAKTEFVSFTVHQLRTPLSALRFSLKMLQQGDFGKLNYEQQKVANHNFKETETLLAQISNLLDISKIELRQVNISKSSFSLEKFIILVKGLLEKYTPLSKKKNISLDFFAPKEIPLLSIRVDWDKIAQALENLLENALNYTPLNGKIFVRIHPELKILNISVSDTGIGIPLKEQKKIFNKFFRASNAKKILSKGTGLGLYLTKFFIESHNGKIWFESKEGWGTTFYFTLPYHQPKVAAEKAIEKL